MSKAKDSGSYVKLYIGCMYSGKSSSLLKEINRYKVITDKILVINHTIDKGRHSGTKDYSHICTHDNKKHEAILITKLNELMLNELYTALYNDARLVVIDEGQFFDDLYTFISTQTKKENDKTFIIGGLSGDSNMKPIGQIIDIIPLADEIIKLNAYCTFCKDGTIASFTKRMIENDKQILVGKEDIYLPACRFHYLN